MGTYADRGRERALESARLYLESKVEEALERGEFATLVSVDKVPSQEWLEALGFSAKVSITGNFYCITWR